MEVDKNLYETIIIFDSTNEEYEKSIEKFARLCQEFTGNEYEINEDDVGIKKLAYEIKEREKGYYVIFTWLGTSDNVAEFERRLRIDDTVLKFMTIRKRDEDHTDEDEIINDDLSEEFIISQGLKKSEQDNSDAGSSNPNSKIDALDVMLGLAEYIKAS